MHFIHAVDGMPEGVEAYKRNIDRHGFGHYPMRLRPIQFFDLQFDERDLDEIYNEFYYTTEERVMKDRVSFSFKDRISPFKHGRFRTALNTIVKTMGWPLGIEPFEPWKRTTIKDAVIPKPGCNIYGLGLVKDNHIVNDAYGRVEEFL